MKVALFKVYSAGNYYDSDDIPMPAVTEWIELSEEELAKLHKTVVTANSAYNSGYRYTVLSQEKTLDGVYKDAADFIAKVEAETQKREAIAAKQKAAREAGLIAKKQKQLEKLKKELGEA